MSSTHRKKAARALAAELSIPYQRALAMVIKSAASQPDPQRGSSNTFPRPERGAGTLILCRGVCSASTAALALGLAAACDRAGQSGDGFRRVALVDFDSADWVISRALSTYMPSLINVQMAWEDGDDDFVEPNLHRSRQIDLDVLPPPIRVKDRDALSANFIIALFARLLSTHDVVLVTAHHELNEGAQRALVSRADIGLSAMEDRIVSVTLAAQHEDSIEVPHFAARAEAADSAGDLLLFLSAPEIQEVFDSLISRLSDALPAQSHRPLSSTPEGQSGPLHGPQGRDRPTTVGPAPERGDLLARLRDELRHGYLSGLVAVAGGNAETRRLLCDNLASQLPQGTSLMEPSLLAKFGGDPHSYLRNLLQEVRVRTHIRPRFLPLDLADPHLDAEHIAMLSRCLTACIQIDEAAPSGIRVELWKPGEAEALPWLRGEGTRGASH